MAEYIEIAQAKTLSGLRIVLPPGRPNPWGEALKGMCYVKKIPYTRVRKAQGYDAALQAWTSQSSAPVAVWNDEDVAGLQPHRRVPAKRGPASATPDDVIRHDVFGAWEHDRRKFCRGRDLVYPGGRHLHREEQRTSEPGCPQDIGQNIDVAVFSCCGRRTRGAGLGGGSSSASPGCWGRQRGRSVMVLGHDAILYSPRCVPRIRGGLTWLP